MKLHVFIFILFLLIKINKKYVTFFFLNHMLASMVENNLIVKKKKITFELLQCKHCITELN